MFFLTDHGCMVCVTCWHKTASAPIYFLKQLRQPLCSLPCHARRDWATFYACIVPCVSCPFICRVISVVDVPALCLQWNMEIGRHASSSSHATSSSHAKSHNRFDNFGHVAKSSASSPRRCVVQVLRLGYRKMSSLPWSWVLRTLGTCLKCSYR